MEPILIAKENTPAVLQRIGQDIADVIDGLPGELSFSQVVEELYTATRQLWILPTEAGEMQGWLTARLVLGKDGVRRLWLDLMGGHDAEILIECLPYIENFYLRFGATEVRALVRPGLYKKLPDFKLLCNMVSKPLKGRLH